MKKHIVELTAQERVQLQGIIGADRMAAHKRRHAQMLLKADQGPHGPGWTDRRVAEAFDVTLLSVERLRRRLVERGLALALEHGNRGSYRAKALDGQAEARVIALACVATAGGSKPLDASSAGGSSGGLGHGRVLQQIIAASRAEKNALKPHLNKYWGIPPKQNAEFVAHMEDVLDVYTRAFDPSQPLVCLDETSKQLITQTRPSLPTKPGQVKRVDPEYRRNGMASVFLMSMPLEGKRYVRVREHRKRQDFAEVVRELCDELYPDAQKIVLVMDQLNTHNIASLYQAFEPAEAKRLAEKLEIHHTPKHGSWLNMAEIELSVLSRQCISDYFETREQLAQTIAVWEQPRNKNNAGIDGQFTNADARIKLKRLYPTI